LDRFQATPGYPAASPSGKYRLIVVTGFNGESHFAQFQITTNERHPHVLFCSEDHFRTRDTTYILWGEKDTVWVYSGDVGIYYWVALTDDHWVKRSHADRRPKGRIVPEFLKRRRPRFFEP
jgi:hypothetical protein